MVAAADTARYSFVLEKRLHQVDFTFDAPSARETPGAPRTGTLQAWFVPTDPDHPAWRRSPLPYSYARELGFTGEPATTLTVIQDLPWILIGTGSEVGGHAEFQNLGRALGQATRAPSLSVHATNLHQINPGNGSGALQSNQMATAVFEGVLLSHYAYGNKQASTQSSGLKKFNVVTEEPNAFDQLLPALQRSLTLANATNMARDLANLPGNELTAQNFADMLGHMAPQFGLGVEVFSNPDLHDLGCGGILGVNAGSTEPARLIKLTYAPARQDAETPHLSLVGKGITYDSGGISLKTDDPLHVHMKMDMAGAAAVFAAMTTLRELDCQNTLTAWLPCTDNMISQTATKLGDVLHLHDGTTVEVTNTDAEGRLVLADALSLAAHQDLPPHAIVNLATLTESSLVALGELTAAVYSNSGRLFQQLESASEQSGESIWRLPLDGRYRSRLNSVTADLRNYSPGHGRGILAALFLQEFVTGIPWCHIDMVSTMLEYHPGGADQEAEASGFGTRLLAELALNFERP